MEPGEFYIQEGGAHSQFPEGWKPQFVKIGDDSTYKFKNEWVASEDGEDVDDIVHYMSFVSMMKLSPGDSCLYIGGGACTTLSVPHRVSFLRVPPNHQYAVATQSHEEFDDFGLFRTYQRTYNRGGQNSNTATRRCDCNEDCGKNGYCDVESHVCAGGITGDYGETDALAFLRPRHGFYEQSLTGKECLTDWHCDGRFEDAPGTSGSVCDRAAKQCTIPLSDRKLRKVCSEFDGEEACEVGSVSYYLSQGYPKHLVKAAFEVTGNWNEVFMRGWREARGLESPDYASVDMQCQTADPTAYCYCLSPDVSGDDTCKGKYDPFTTPEQYAAMGVQNAYQCHVQNDEFNEPSAPTTYDEYSIPQAYRYEFIGDECMFVLRTNACDWHRSDASVACDDVTDTNDEKVVYQQMGDLRYQFFNYIDQSNTPFGGVSALRVDPTTGELITAHASFSAGSVENMATRALEYFPALRCGNEDLGCAQGEEGADERYLTGENVRGYFARLGQVEHPATLAPTGDGFSNDDQSRPSQPVDLGPALRDVMLANEARIESLRGINGRTQILSDRLRNLAGTSFEQKLMGSMGVDGWESMSNVLDRGKDHVYGLSPAMSIQDESVLDQVSPFRGNAMMRTLNAERRDQEELANHGICSINEGQLNSRYWAYFAEAFRGRPLAEASIRMQQLYTRMVQHHVLGYSVDLRHNFGASFDRNNYGDGYFNVVLDQNNPLPLRDAFDLNNDSILSGAEYDLYLKATRRIRNERAEKGVHNYMSSSTMDYSGDLSDSYELGRYDVAATIWNYFDMKEAYDLRTTNGGKADLQTASNGPHQGLHKTTQFDRVWWKSYLGGESCSVNTECPYTKGSGALVSGQPVYQRCVQNPRTVSPQEECRGHNGCVCSNFDSDMQDYADDEFGHAFEPVPYMFCSDERTNDISWCNRYDAGESFTEVIDHYRRRWEENCPVTYYRRFRDTRLYGQGSYGSIVDAAKIYQHLFFRYNFEPGFRFNNGPLGFQDQFLASVDAMN